MNPDQIATFMKQFPLEAEILQMSPEDLGMHLLKAMCRPHGPTNRFNFVQMIPGGQISLHFMEAWAWLAREGFIAIAPNDMNGQNYFVTRAGDELARTEDIEAWRKAHLFPDHFEAALVRYVKPLFSRGDYDTAIFRAFKEVETRVRKKAGLSL